MASNTSILSTNSAARCSFTLTLVWRCLHWKHPFRLLVCALRFVTRPSDGSAMSPIIPDALHRMCDVRHEVESEHTRIRDGGVR
jgi:hypothetical protein